MKSLKTVIRRFNRKRVKAWNEEHFICNGKWMSKDEFNCELIAELEQIGEDTPIQKAKNFIIGIPFIIAAIPLILFITFMDWRSEMKDIKNKSIN